MAFVNAPVLLPRSTLPSRTAVRGAPRMASVSRGLQRPRIIVAPDAPPPEREPVPEVAELEAVSAAVCEFMNTERLRDLATYIVRFGNNFDDLEQLTDVRMTKLDAAGFTADVVSCDDSSHCVCVQERLEWPLGLCHSSSDVIDALKHLSAACGLPTDF